MSSPAMISFLIVCTYVQPSACLPLAAINSATSNATKTVDDDPRLICTPTKATDVLIFFFANYFAHCATLIPEPGETLWQSLEKAFFALLSPVSGIEIAVQSILRSSFSVSRKLPFVGIKPNDLQTAARCGALVTVIRDYRSWEPREEHTDTEKTSRTMKRPRMDSRVDDIIPWSNSVRIHGVYQLPRGYKFARVPGSAKIWPCLPPSEALNKPEDSSHTSLVEYVSSSYSFAKSAIAIVQAIYAGVTLYRTKSGQLQRYGCAAFGLTVTPYLLMSIVNLVAQIATPQYPARYIVDSKWMKEARSRGGYFDGVIGSLIPAALSGEKPLVNRDGAKPNEGRHSGPAPHNKPLQDSEAEISPIPGDTKSSIAISPRPDIESTETHVKPRSNIKWGLIARISAVVISLLSIAIIGIISQFKSGNSTAAQRGIILTWILSGCVLSPLSDIVAAVLITSLEWDTIKPVKLQQPQNEDDIENIRTYLENRQIVKRRARHTFKIFRGVLGSIAIAGFVVVGMELVDYGNCVQP